MKQYKLLKDLPGIPAGEIKTEEEWEKILGRMLEGPCIWMHKWANEWFQEIPDYSFVRDGDVYANYNPPFVTRIEKGRAFNGCTAKSGKDYKFEGWESPVESHYARDSFKPENLVYRPGKNPWDTPEVDKLGWGPMEKKSEGPKPKTTFYIEDCDGTHGHIVHELFPNGADVWRGSFVNKEDAELFKAALEKGNKE